MFRYRGSERFYYGNGRHKNPTCPFCTPGEVTVVQDGKYCQLVKNTYPYDLWEFREVIDHLMVIPKRHVPSLSMLTKQERAEIMDLISDYEANEYNVYIRSHKSVHKSILGHQHTHLIATKTIHAKFVVYVLKPYWLFRR
jgi:diadenosine tetraphosphate (Ap4A) HIT family hydrolase